MRLPRTRAISPKTSAARSTSLPATIGARKLFVTSHALSIHSSQ